MNKIGRLLVPGALCCLVQPAYAQQSGFPVAPEQASTIAPRVDTLFYVIFWLAFIIASGVCLLILIFSYRYRRGSDADRSNPPVNNVVVEATWITIPILLSIGIFVWAAKLFYDEETPPPGAITINVIGMQWYWQIQHPGGQQELDELHVPVGQAVRLNMISLDVVHSFWVPAFRIKQDVLPGRYTTAWFQATRPGRYHLFCAQYCGAQHANMVGWVDVMSPSDYQNWLRGNHTSPSLATVGARLFIQYSCTGCHAHSATVRAPSLNGLYGKPVPLSDGSVTVADDKYLHDSIVLPGSQVVAGYQNIMPSYQGAMNEGQLLALVAYIRSLGREPEQENTMQSQGALTRARVREMQRRAVREQTEMKRRISPASDYPGRIDALKPPQTPGVPTSSGADLRMNTPAARNPSGTEPESGGPPATSHQSPATNYESDIEPKSGRSNP